MAAVFLVLGVIGFHTPHDYMHYGTSRSGTEKMVT